jgi:hypothetical protein
MSVVEAAPELSAKEIKANEKAARKIELAAKKEARLTKKNVSLSIHKICMYFKREYSDVFFYEFVYEYVRIRIS